MVTFFTKSILKRIGIAAINGRNGLDVFDEDTGVRAGAAEVDDDVVRTLNGLLFQHAAFLLAFHDLTYFFDVVDFKGNVGNAALAVIEVFQDTFARDDEFNGRAVLIFLVKMRSAW